MRRGGRATNPIVARGTDTSTGAKGCRWWRAGANRGGGGGGGGPPHAGGRGVEESAGVGGGARGAGGSERRWGGGGGERGGPLAPHRAESVDPAHSRARRVGVHELLLAADCRHRHP